MAENQLCLAAPTRLVGHTRVSFQETLDNLQAEDKVNHLTKTSSKLSSQIHKVMPHPQARFYTLMAGSVHSGKQEARVFLMPQLRNLAQSGSLLHSGLRHPPSPPRTQLYFLLYFLSLQLEDNWKQEKKIWAEVEKARRKAESDLKISTDHLNEMERSKLDLQEVVKKYALFHFTCSSVSNTEHFLDSLCSGLCVLNALPQHPPLCKAWRIREEQVGAPCAQGAPSLTQGHGHWTRG